MQNININQAIQYLSQGKVVILPFEGHYILACQATNTNAVNLLLQDKQKKATQPLSILLPNLRSLKAINVESPLITVAQQIWPAPLSVTIPAFPGLPSEVSGLTQMINLQIPSHSIVSHIITELDQPLLISSANPYALKPATTKEQCENYHFQNANHILEGEISEQCSTLIAYGEHGITFKEIGALTPTDVLSLYKSFGFAG